MKMKGLGRGLDALLAGDAADAKKDQQRTLPIDALKPGKYQPRTRMDEGSLKELAASIQAQGIVPDIEVSRAKVTREQDDENFKEADLAGHLGNGNGGADKPSNGKGKAAGQSPRPQDDDFQLSQALNLLKGLSVTRGE